MTGRFGHVALIARIRLARQVRSTLAQPWIAFLQVVGVVFGVVIVVGRLPLPGYAAVWSQPGAYAFGRRLFAGDPSVLPTVRGFAGVVFVLLVFLTILKEATDGALDTNADALLLATDARTVAAGEITWSTLFAGWQFGIPLLAAAVAFGAGARSVLAGVGAGVAAGSLVALAVPTGYVAALTARLGFQTIPALRNNKAILGAPLALVYFALFLRARQSIATLSAVPLGWFGDLALLGVPGAGADPVRAGSVLVAVPTLAGGLVVLAGRLGRASWFGDRHRDETTSSEGLPAPLRTGLSAVAGRPAGAVARTVWVRLLREPRVLMFAALPLALTATLGVEVVALQPAALPVVVAVYVAAAVGMGATLNPLGNVGAGLPATLTTPGGGRAVVDGYVLSATVPGIPLVVGLSVLAGLSVGLGAATVVAAAVVGAVLTVAAAVVSVWIGTALPNYESLRATSESGVRPPRLVATTTFLLVVVVLGLPATIGVGWAPAVAAAVGTAPVVPAVGGLGLTCVGAGVLSAVAYRRSLTAIADYRIE